MFGIWVCPGLLRAPPLIPLDLMPPRERRLECVSGVPGVRVGRLSPIDTDPCSPYLDLHADVSTLASDSLQVGVTAGAAFVEASGVPVNIGSLA